MYLKSYPTERERERGCLERKKNGFTFRVESFFSFLFYFERNIHHIPNKHLKNVKKTSCNMEL